MESIPPCYGIRGICCTEIPLIPKATEHLKAIVSRFKIRVKCMPNHVTRLVLSFRSGITISLFSLNSSNDHTMWNRVLWPIWSSVCRFASKIYRFIAWPFNYTSIKSYAGRAIQGGEAQRVVSNRSTNCFHL